MCSSQDWNPAHPSRGPGFFPQFFLQLGVHSLEESLLPRSRFSLLCNGDDHALINAIMEMKRHGEGIARGGKYNSPLPFHGSWVAASKAVYTCVFEEAQAEARDPKIPGVLFPSLLSQMSHDAF